MKLDLSENNKFLIIREAEELEYEQLKSSFTKKVDGWRFHPLVKRGIWNGEISFVKGNKLPSGLWKEASDIFKEYNLELKITGINKLFNLDITREDLTEWVKSFFEGYAKYPRDYQIETAYRILKYRRCLAELATSAGKSLIVFMVIGYILEKNLAERIILIVPNVSLVIQASEDFTDYNHISRLKIKIQQIYAGAKIREDSNLVIGTYQSLVKKKEEYFKQFDAVIVDETHKANATSIRKILDHCWHCEYRFGVSGTVPKRGTVNRLTLMANTGPLVTNVSADYLIKKGHISPCEVKVIRMNYAKDDDREAFHFLSKTPEDRKKLFVLEQNYVISNYFRLKFVSTVITKAGNNSLVLFHRIEHGKALFDQLQKVRKEGVYYVDGGTNKDDRELYKAKMEEGIGKILVASFGTFSTGINITNLHNVFLTESFKSEIIIRQSIGRGLRKHDRKDKLMIIDFVDDIRFKLDNGKKWKNYLFKHGEKRLEIYKEQKFPYTIKNISF